MFDTALLLITNILPLYGLIALGYAGGRWLDVNLHSMAIVAIYLIAPIVNFGAMAQLDFDPDYAVLPVILFCASAATGLLMLYVATLRWKNNTANLIALGSVSGNTGYFGLPLVMTLFGPEWVGLYLFMNLALLLSEVSLGYYMAARGHADFKTALKKVFRLPVIYAIAAGLIANFSGFEMPDVLNRYWTYATGAWVFIGMMLIGVALSKQPKLELDLRLAGWMFFAKFIIWPCIGAAIILSDMFIFQAYDPTVYKLIAIFTAVPLAGNIVAFATNLNLHPERAATVVLASTVFAVVSVPAALTLVTWLSP